MDLKRSTTSLSIATNGRWVLGVNKVFQLADFSNVYLSAPWILDLHLLFLSPNSPFIFNKIFNYKFAHL